MPGNPPGILFGCENRPGACKDTKNTFSLFGQPNDKREFTVTGRTVKNPNETSGQ
jgi:hypothetical protein